MIRVFWFLIGLLAVMATALATAMTTVGTTPTPSLGKYGTLGLFPGTRTRGRTVTDERDRRSGVPLTYEIGHPARPPSTNRDFGRTVDSSGVVSSHGIRGSTPSGFAQGVA